MANYIYEHRNWTKFTWQDQGINVVFGEVRLMQGKIIEGFIDLRSVFMTFTNRTF